MTSNKLILALGADIKNQTAAYHKNRICRGPALGDLSYAENFEQFKKAIGRIIKKAGRAPDIIAIDLHPGYYSSMYGRKLSAQYPKAKLHFIQHHQAHLASVIYENNLERTLIGIAMDGTGYGLDGNMWGGEVFVIDGARFQRRAHFQYRKMPGGDKVVKEPWRMVLSILGQNGIKFVKGVDKRTVDAVLLMAEKDINSPLSSSAGRLFDAAAALIVGVLSVNNEAEGPIKLESVIHPEIKEAYRYKDISRNGELIIDTDNVFIGIAEDVANKTDKGIVSAKFHNTIVKIIVETVKKIASRRNVGDVVLSGGVFQNKYLMRNTTSALQQEGYNIFTNMDCPVNDYNISIGQIYLARSS